MIDVIVRNIKELRAANSRDLAIYLAVLNKGLSSNQLNCVKSKLLEN